MFSRSRRLFSTQLIKTLQCSDCRFYDPKSQICKVNYLLASHNRADETICGVRGEKYLAKDTRNLLKSETCLNYSKSLFIFGIFTTYYTLLVDLRVVDLRVFIVSLCAFYGSNVLEKKSIDYYRKYLNDNNLNGNDGVA